MKAKLSKIGIHNRFDLLLHLPLRYVDETRIYSIADAPIGETVLVEGTVTQSKVMFRPRRQLVARVEDESDSLQVRLFQFYPNQQKALAEGNRVRLLGEIRRSFAGAEMVHPQFRAVREAAPVADTLTPIYPTTASLPQSALRKLIEKALKEADLADTLPADILDKLGLSPFDTSLRMLHHPRPEVSQEAIQNRSHPAWRRLAFDELLAQQISMRLHYRRRRAQGAPALEREGKLAHRFLESLPFALTRAQQRVTGEISADLAQPHPMQRLLLGDVGSGKTVVAALAALQAIGNGFQAALMAPTEILAEQHALKLKAWLEPLDIRIAWLASGLSKKEKTAALESLASGEAALAIGTHALFQEQVAFHNLALAIIDEQHRFGVHQRLALRQKGTQVHQLMMSATPIPRTLSMSYYADLDVSVIDELPPGRTPVVTKLVSDARREEIIERVREACAQGRQAYWVCPLIEESESLQLQTALDTYEAIRQTFPDLSVGLVHGRLKPAEKAAVMDGFKKNETQLLVATTVIEVGVDVPNASLMVIENAERMGLSQLHQLRGRVGRGAAESACILLYSQPLSENATARLRTIYECSDGFEIAKKDLELRGPGEFLGARQSGVPMLKVADITRDQDLLDNAREIADQLLAHAPDTARAHMERWLGGRADLLKV